ncbi:unnamed protein product [Caenorhabditis brenneri]
MRRLFLLNSIAILVFVVHSQTYAEAVEIRQDPVPVQIKRLLAPVQATQPKFRHAMMMFVFILVKAVAPEHLHPYKDNSNAH